MADTDFVLVEWPRMHIPPATTRVSSSGIVARGRGIDPVVAHPERYVGVGEALDVVRSWRDAGAALQVNYGSFVGRYGSDAERRTRSGCCAVGWATTCPRTSMAARTMKLYKR
jgi:protein-tyrosine phosphatase